MISQFFQCSVDVLRELKSLFTCYDIEIDKSLDNCYAIERYKNNHDVFSDVHFTRELARIADDCLSSGLVGMTYQTVYSTEYEMFYGTIICHDADVLNHIASIPSGIDCYGDKSIIYRREVYLNERNNITFFYFNDMLNLVKDEFNNEDLNSSKRRLQFHLNEMDRTHATRKKDMDSYCTPEQYYRDNPEEKYESDTSVSLKELRDGTDLCYGACWIRRYTEDYMTGKFELIQHWARCFPPALNLWKVGALPKPDLFPPVGVLHNPNYTLCEIYLLHQITVAIPNKYEYPFGWLLANNAYKMVSKIIKDQTDKDKVKEVFDKLKLNKW